MRNYCLHHTCLFRIDQTETLKRWCDNSQHSSPHLDEDSRISMNPHIVPPLIQAETLKTKEKRSLKVESTCSKQSLWRISLYFQCMLKSIGPMQNLEVQTEALKTRDSPVTM